MLNPGSRLIDGMLLDVFFTVVYECYLVSRLTPQQCNIKSVIKPSGKSFTGHEDIPRKLHLLLG